MKIIEGSITDKKLLGQNGIDTIAHGCNIHSTMGAGVALSIKHTFPVAYQADIDFPIEESKRLGKYSVGVHKVWGDYNIEPIKIVNLYQQTLGGKTPLQIDKLEMALTSFVSQNVFNKIALPWQIGCGLAGGDFSVVKPMIEKILEPYDAVWIKFNG
jgi:O-acetyl-ADP-ribose deacetylase (regulator of RNase III)